MTKRTNTLSGLEWSPDAFAALLAKKYDDLEAAAKDLNRYAPPGSKITKQHLHNWSTGRNVPNMKFYPAISLGLGLPNIMPLFKVRK